MKFGLHFIDRLPSKKTLGAELLLIYDEVLPRASVHFKKWMQGFPLSYGVKSGENLKAVEAFPQHISRIVKLCEKTSSRNLTLVVVGGGSVGDFGGFVASVLKRGVSLVHIPSTWLAAIDSAHGGKTALNVGGAKNQIGTFYPAQKIFLVRSLLLGQPPPRTFEGFGELLKIALIAGGSFWQRLSLEDKVNPELLWRYLPDAVNAKYRVVQKDPEERTGYRHLLNLGHTLGHVLESYHQIPHGVAINYGLSFALQWGLHLKIMSSREYEKLMSRPIMGYLLNPALDKLLIGRASMLRRFRQLLMSDKKKKTSDSLRFVFLKKPGQCLIREVSIEEVLAEASRQREVGFHGSI